MAKSKSIFISLYLKQQWKSVNQDAYYKLIENNTFDL